MVELYESKGVQRADAELIINTMAKSPMRVCHPARWHLYDSDVCRYKEFFVEHMMVTELGVMPPDPDESPAAKGICTFLAFMVFGAVPLLVLGVLRFATSDHNTVLLIACIATAITLFLLGIIKGFAPVRQERALNADSAFSSAIIRQRKVRSCRLHSALQRRHRSGIRLPDRMGPLAAILHLI